MSTRHRPTTRVLAIAIAVAAIGAITSIAGPASSTDAHRSADRSTDDGIVVDVNSIVRPIQQDLLGIHARDNASTITSGGYDDLGPRTYRHVMSTNDFMAYDCNRHRIEASSLDHFDRWLDAVAGTGADAILSLSYVPSCYAAGGYTKAPVTDRAGYRRFLDELLHHLVTERAASGKVPLRRLELWNEPDIPIDPGLSAGHGYRGTVDDFIATNLPGLIGAIRHVEAESGQHLLVGSPAAFSPWPMSRFGSTIADLLVNVNGFDPAAAAATSDQVSAAFGTDLAGRLLHSGGVAWPQKVDAAAARLGRPVDFVSVHLYPNNPLQGVGWPEPTGPPQALFGRNPVASPEQFADLVSDFGSHFPGQELVVSEWALSAGDDHRMDSCEGSAFNAASLSVMQDVGIDRAIYLGRPTAPADAGLRAWHLLPATQVAAAVGDHRDTWLTAASDHDRTTVIVSQWTSLLADARDRTLPLTVRGLPDGTYDITIDSVGAEHPNASGRIQASATSTDGVLRLTGGVRLDGQSVARVDVHRATVADLPALTLGSATTPPGQCLPSADAPSPTTTASPSSAPAPSSVPTPASTPLSPPPAVAVHAPSRFVG